MSDKNFYGFNLNSVLKKRLKLAADKKYTKVGPLLNEIIAQWLDVFENVVHEQKKPIRTPEENAAAIEEAKASLLSKSIPGEYKGDKVTITAGNPPPEFILE